MELSKEAKRALVNTAPRRGARVSGPTAVLDELFNHRLVSGGGNLTEAGVIVRARILDEMLEAM